MERSRATNRAWVRCRVPKCVYGWPAREGDKRLMLNMRMRQKCALLVSFRMCEGYKSGEIMRINIHCGTTWGRLPLWFYVSNIIKGNGFSGDTSMPCGSTALRSNTGCLLLSCKEEGEGRPDRRKDGKKQTYREQRVVR